jgi:hypothetical protein
MWYMLHACLDKARTRNATHDILLEYQGLWPPLVKLLHFRWACLLFVCIACVNAAPTTLRKFGDVTGPGSKATWRCSGAYRPTHHLAGLATKQDGSEPVSTLHYMHSFILVRLQTLLRSLLACMLSVLLLCTWQFQASSAWRACDLTAINTMAALACLRNLRDFTLSMP